MKPPDYTFDLDRLGALAQFAVLDTPPEQGFDDVVELASYVCQAPVALVSLVAEDRQWFKARIGFDECQTDLNSSVCAHALIEPDLLVVPDLSLDQRTKQNPLVTGEPHIRFYAGVPLRTAEGHAVGSLCVIDTLPRPDGLTAGQAKALRNLGRQVIDLLEMRRAVAQRDLLLIGKKDAEIRRNGLLNLGDVLRDAKTIAQITQSAAKVVGETLGIDRAAFGRLDATGEYVEVEPDWTAGGILSITGRHRFADYGSNLTRGLLQGKPLVIEDVLTDPMTAGHADALLKLDVRSLVNIPVIEHGRTVAMLIVHAKEPRSWSPETMAYLRNVADRVEVAVARLQAEMQQQVLNHELSHRMKNTMSLVQAIASQTLKAIPDQAPVKAFSERVLALSVAHDLLLQQNWIAAQIGDVIEMVVGTFGDVARFEISGPTVSLGSRATLSLSLLLHELTANALKYGALSNGAGKVSITWLVENRASELALQLRWQESGGPQIVEPIRKGFGSKLIRMGLAGTGETRCTYPTGGFEAEFIASLADLQT